MKVICPERSKCKIYDCIHKKEHDSRKYNCFTQACRWKKEKIYCIRVINDSKKIIKELDRILDI